MEVRSIETIVRALNAAKAQYLIVGGLAVNAHGYERLTVDVDLVIGLQRENIMRALRALQVGRLADGHSGDAGRICESETARIVAAGKKT